MAEENKIYNSTEGSNRLNFWEVAIYLTAFCVIILNLIPLLYREELVPILVQFWKMQKQHFTLGRISFLLAFTPILMTLGFSICMSFFFPKPNIILKAICGFTIVFLVFRYLGWRAFATLNLDNVPEGILSVFIFVAEFIMIVDTTFASCIQTIPSTDLSAEADVLSKDVKEKRYVPCVDVLIPSYNEPEEVLKRTIIGCQAMDYPKKKIYLLDDTRRPHIKKLTEQLGCFYIDRPDNQHAKAGNINNALKKINSELVTIFDADFVPCKNYLTRMVGFFQDPKVALVQTPQHFYSPDPIEANLGLEGNITNEQALFFRHIQPSRDAANAIICCGTCYVIRRSMMDEIGGIPTESIAEDFFTSVKLIAKGYRLRYLNEALSAGEAAPTIGAYVDQRLRWGQGTIQCLYCYHSPMTTPGLNFLQRAYYFSSMTYWFMPVWRFILFCGPLTYLIFGLNPLRATLEGILFYFVPYYVSHIMLFSWLNKSRRSVFWSNIYETLLCVPMALTVVKSLINPFGKGFKVTPKGVETSKLEINWIVIRPLVVLASLYAAGFVIRASNLPWEANPEPVYVNLGWAAYNLLVFWGAIMCAMDVPKRKFVAFKHSLNYTLKCGYQSVVGKTAKISEGDVLIEITDEERKKLNIGASLDSEITLEILEIGLQEIKVRIVDPKNTIDKDVRQPNKLLREIIDLKTEDERKLVEFLYCRPGMWDKETKKNETSYFISFVQSIFRMNPLAND